MIGLLPKFLQINGIGYQINTDYRNALNYFVAYNDVDLSDELKTRVLLECVYRDYEKIPMEHIDEAIKQACWYIDGGKEYENSNNPKVLDWEQDEQLIFAEVNKVANKEVRELSYMHWWTFLGYMTTIGEGLLSSILHIRTKKAKGQKLDKGEQDFYNQNLSMVKLKVKLTAEEQAEVDKLKALLG